MHGIGVVDNDIARLRGKVADVVVASGAVDVGQLRERRSGEREDATLDAGKSHALEDVDLTARRFPRSGRAARDTWRILRRGPRREN